jgi:asparagine synthase (glutamine-hydrolysing)
MLRHAYVPSPLSIYRNIRKLRPGEVARLSADSLEPATRLYWDARAVAEARASDPFRGTDAEMAERLDALVLDAVASRMIADVPLGAFLSGGIDSSTVVAAMVAAKLGPVRTFTVGFQGTRYDEAPHAAAIAKHLGTIHAEMQVGERECLDLVPRLAHMYDEPFADASQIPTAVLSRLTRKHVTVALSGDGGDELFGGYGRYKAAAAEWGRRASPSFRPIIGAAASVVGAIDAKAGRALRRRTAATPESVYADHVTLWHAEDRITRAPWPGPEALFGYRGVPALASPVRRFMALDALTYLPDDLLAKVDRASMAYGLEVRCPLLDYRIVEFAWSLPDEASFGGGGTKRVLREVLARRVPRTLFERPKSGFEPPVGDWLRGPLRDWGEGLLSPAALDAAGLDPKPIRQRWMRHLDGRNATHPLWSVLAFQAWQAAA